MNDGKSGNIEKSFQYDKEVVLVKASDVLTCISKLLNFEAFRYRISIERKHYKLQESKGRGRKKYYIIRHRDTGYCGWTVWERIVLYNCIYAIDHHMIPVVDMKNYKSIYQEKEQLGKTNIWDIYYKQPAKHTLEEAYNSGNYVLSDPSQEWFNYIRMRRKKCFSNEYLRKCFHSYVRWNSNTVRILEEKYKSILPKEETGKKLRLFGLCVRGTDYKKFHHPKQPSISYLTTLALKKFKEYKCDYFFIATEDYDIFQEIKSKLPENKILTYNAGNIKVSNRRIGVIVRQDSSAYNASIDYLTTLYIINKCTCLLGGVCGATIVAQYRRKEEYEYINIIDMNSQY